MAHIICTVTNDLSQDQRMDRICTSLAKAGHKVWLVGRLKPDSLPLPHRPYERIRLQCKVVKGKLFYAEFNLRLLVFLLRHQCDLINAVDLDTLVPCSLISQWRKTPCIYDAHEYFTETPEVVRRPKVQAIWEKIASVYIPRAKSCYTVGPRLAEIMGKKYGVNFEVIRNLPIQKKQTGAVRPIADKKIILYQGMLNEGRGLETAIEAMQYLDGFELWLAGDGDIKKQLEEMARQNPATRRSVRFHGFIAPALLADITSKAWIGLNLLENKGLSYYYSLANKAFDYIQHGVPSIHMAFPEYIALQQKYDVFGLLNDLDAKALATVIRGLATNTQRYKQLQDNCRIAAGVLKWEKEEEKLLAIYDGSTG